MLLVIGILAGHLGAGAATAAEPTTTARRSATADGAADQYRRRAAAHAYVRLTDGLNADLGRLKGGLTAGEAATRASYLAFADIRRRWLDGVASIALPSDAGRARDAAVVAVTWRRIISEALARAPLTDWDRLLPAWREAGEAEIVAVDRLRLVLGIERVPPVPPAELPAPPSRGGHHHR
jgi:hypothetical protein